MGDSKYKVVKSRKRKSNGDQICYDFEVISEYNPESIIDFYELQNLKFEKRGGRAELLDNARKHLSAIGWTFWSKIKNGTDEWRYVAPSGKRYYSMNVVCKAIAEGVESIGSDDYECNVGGVPGIRKRRKKRDSFVSENKVEGRRGFFVGHGVDEKIESLTRFEDEMSDQEDDYECNVGGVSGIRKRKKKIDSFISGNKVERSDGSRVTRLRKKIESSTRFEDKMSDQENDSDDGFDDDDDDDELICNVGGVSSTGKRKKKRDSFISENKVERSNGVRVTRLRSRRFFVGHAVDEKIESSTRFEDEMSDQGDDSDDGSDDYDELICKKKRNSFISENKVERSDGSRVTRLRSRRFFVGEKSNQEDDDSDESDDSDEADDDDDDDDELICKRVSLRLTSSKKRKVLGTNTSRVLRSNKRVRDIGCSSSSSVSKVPRTVLSWLIENNAVVPRSKVYYSKVGNSNSNSNSNSNEPLLFEGKIARDGITCACCSSLYSLTGFQAHVVGYTNRRPAEYIFLEDGRSLMSCQVDLMRTRTRVSRERVYETPRTEKSNDCVCSICHYGGDLILCDRCPSSFHAKCLNLKGVPEGEWFCASCCCVVCGTNHVDNRLLRCHQCERQYHAHCNKGREMDSPEDNWFCSITCEKMQWGLDQILGKPILVGQANLTWTLLKPMQYDAEDNEHYDTETMAENYSKLSVALEVMHECFEPVKDLRTKRDLVEDVLFSRESNLNRLNFKGFYTVLLERNDELIATALLRVYGEKVAEIPLIGTRFHYRRLGMCRVLMNEIEKTLLNLGVQKLVLPAAPSIVNTWTTSFGFSTIEEADRPQFLGYTFLDFQQTVMCQKLLRKPTTPRLHISRDISSVPRKNDGSIIGHNEGSSMSEVFQEDQHQVGDTVDQGAQANGVPSPTRRVEPDKKSPTKFYIRKNDVKPRHLVSQPNVMIVV